MSTFPYAQPGAAVATLLDQRQAELAELFALLPAPEATAITGRWRGTLMAVSGLGWLPRPLARLLYGFLALPINPWRGKSFGEREGVNRWLALRGPGFLRYAIDAGPSPHDGGPALLLDYGVSANPAPARRILGEVRRLDEGTLLARMSWNGKSGPVTLLYFALRRA